MLWLDYKGETIGSSSADPVAMMEFYMQKTAQELRPPVKMLVPVWKALCAFIRS
ncbi:unnamed protein product [Rhodiola kirilowii]